MRIIIKETNLSYSGIETDWIEEEMSDDDDFRKDVIEQKIKKVLEEIGFTKKIAYKVEILINIEDQRLKSYKMRLRKGFNYFASAKFWTDFSLSSAFLDSTEISKGCKKS